ncbi:7594_t:CDS:2, partial [Paraglomus occultum]
MLIYGLIRALLLEDVLQRPAMRTIRGRVARPNHRRLLTDMPSLQHRRIAPRVRAIGRLRQYMATAIRNPYERGGPSSGNLPNLPYPVASQNSRRSTDSWHDDSMLGDNKDFASSLNVYFILSELGFTTFG